MNCLDYNIGIVSEFAKRNFWNKIDKSLPVMEKRRLYEKFYKENEKMISESVEELLRKRNARMVVNEGFFDHVVSSDEEFEKDIPDEKPRKISSIDDLERENAKKNPIIIKQNKRSDAASEWESHMIITVSNKGDRAYVQQNSNDINFVSDLYYDMITKGDLEGATTQDVELPYSFFNVTSVTDFSAVFAFKDLPNVDLSGWDVSNGTNFEGMFYKSTFNNDSIRGWKLSKCTNSVNMFAGSDFDKQDIIDGWGATISGEEYLPIIGRTSADSTEMSRKKLKKWAGNKEDMQRKVKTLKSYNNQSIMDVEEKQSYHVMDSSEFIAEHYGVNEGRLGDFLAGAAARIRETFRNIGIKLRNGFTFVIGKGMDMFGANLPENIVNFIKSGGVRGVYAENGKAVTYPEKPGYYDKIEKGSMEYDNYVRFLNYVAGNTSGVSESYEINERRVGLKSIERENGIDFVNIDAPDYNTRQLENLINDNLSEILEFGAPTGKPVLVWGAPGIGKTSIPKTLIKEANKAIVKNGGTNYDKLSIIVVDCSVLEAGDLTMPMPVKVTGSDIARIKQIPQVQELIKKKNLADKDLVDYISEKSSDAPKTWLPMWKPTGDPEIDAVRKAEANGKVDVVIDENNKDGLVKSTSEVRGGGGILMFDEFLRADPDTLFGIAQIMMNRETASGYVLGDKWYCMACSNRPTDDIQVSQNWQGLSDALKQRFKSINFVPDFKDWCKWAKEKGGFDDFTLEFIGARGVDGPSSRWHNIDPIESTAQNKVRQISPRQWSFCIEELNRLCKIRHLKSYTELGDEFLLTVRTYLPDTIAKEYVEDYEDNNAFGAFKYSYSDIIKNPDLKVSKDAKSVTITNHLKREIQRMYNVNNPIPADELGKIIRFLESNFDDKTGNTSSDFIARVFKYCDLIGVNFKEGDPESQKYLDIWNNYQVAHPKINLKSLLDSIPNSMI